MPLVVAFSAAWSTAFFAVPMCAQEFTVQVGAPTPAPTSLVRHDDVWRYHLGTNSPGANWQTVADASLDASWYSGPGGFGFSNDYAAETNRCATVMAAMFNTISTLYTRQTFVVSEPIDPTRHISLTVDFDDGFVAFLDGVEVARFNAPGSAGTEPARTAVATTSHESSNGNPNNTPLPAMTFDLGPVGGRLAPGSHVLAVLGLNRANDSSDFVLVSDLSLVGGSQTTLGGSLFAIANTNVVALSGSNTFANSTRVTVNGNEASFNTATRQWSYEQSLQPGLNRLFFAALDPTGAIVTSTNRDVLFQTGGITAGGVLAGDTVWDGANGMVQVTSTVVVPSGATLRITNGAAVLFAANASLRTTNGLITVDGTEAKPILFVPSDGETPWGDLGAFGSNAVLTLREAEVVAGQIRPVDGATVLVEDSVIRDLNVTGREIIAAVSGGGLTLRRVYGARFAEMDARDTPVLIEDSLLEDFSVDGLDIKTTLEQPLVIQRTTIRRGDVDNSNADGIDFGPGAGTVRQCLIYGFPDKGISLGTAPGTTVQDTIIFRCGSGFSVNSSTNCFIENTTISGCATGLFFRAAGSTISHLAGTNVILWGNSNTIVFTGNSTLDLAFSDVEGGYPGPGNIAANPLFLDAAGADYRLAAGSPARGSGVGGSDMGPSFAGGYPGGLPPTPFRLAATASGLGEIHVTWQEDADNESGFELERSLDAQSWTLLASPSSGGLVANVRAFVDTTAQLAQRYYYRVRAVNPSGASRYSNIAGSIRQEPTLTVGGTLSADTTWSPALGTILVVSSVTVPTNVTLTIAPGTVVKVTNSAAIRAVAGGTIHVAGTVENKATIASLVPGAIWGELSGQFSGSRLTLQHADISGGQITVYSNAVGLLEDSYIHDYRLLSGGTLYTSPIILTHYAAPTVVRRCHVREFHETLWRNGILTIEDSLFENIHGDAVDFDSAQPGTVLRRCTFRHGNSGNVDAVDVGPGDIAGSFDVRIEDSMMFDFPFDKGVSVGDRGTSHGTIVSNCFIFSCLSGVMAKDLCDVSVRHCTIVNNIWGLTNYNKVTPSAPDGGGITTNTYNNIIFDNDITISMVNASLLFADHNILSNTNWPGTGNIDVDPLFVNPLANDYRLQTSSPARGAGRDGADLGATFPVGCAMVRSHPEIAGITAGNGQAVVRFWADNEKSYSLLSSAALSGSPWIRVADVGAGATLPRFLSVTNALAPDNRFYRLVTPRMP